MPWYLGGMAETVLAHCALAPAAPTRGGPGTRGPAVGAGSWCRRHREGWKKRPRRFGAPTRLLAPSSVRAGLFVPRSHAPTDAYLELLLTDVAAHARENRET
jgi:hypothetical protein